MTDVAPDRCGSCVHWQNPWDDGPWVDDDPEGHPIVPLADAPRWGTCELIEMADNYQPSPVEISAFTMDGSGYKADLHTRDDFGCVLHEPR